MSPDSDKKTLSASDITLVPGSTDQGTKNGLNASENIPVAPTNTAPENPQPLPDPAPSPATAPATPPAPPAPPAPVAPVAPVTPTVAPPISPTPPVPPAEPTQPASPTSNMAEKPVAPNATLNKPLKPESPAKPPQPEKKKPAMTNSVNDQGLYSVNILILDRDRKATEVNRLLTEFGHLFSGRMGLPLARRCQGKCASVVTLIAQATKPELTEFHQKARAIQGIVLKITLIQASL
jgi:hypothetical protein